MHGFLGGLLLMTTPGRTSTLKDTSIMLQQLLHRKSELPSWLFKRHLLSLVEATIKKREMLR